MKKERTSLSHPIHVDWVIENVGVTHAPGKKASSMFGPPWNRDLDLDLERLKKRYKADVLISLIEDHELESLHIDNLVEKCEENSITIYRSSIVDGSIPSLQQAKDIVEYAFNEVERGKRVIFHCRGGLGRAGTLCACLLTKYGFSSMDAIKRTRLMRRGAIENTVQENFIHDFVS